MSTDSARKPLLLHQIISAKLAIVAGQTAPEAALLVKDHIDTLSRGAFSLKPEDAMTLAEAHKSLPDILTESGQTDNADVAVEMLAKLQARGEGLEDPLPGVDEPSALLASSATGALVGEQVAGTAQGAEVQRETVSA